MIKKLLFVFGIFSFGISKAQLLTPFATCPDVNVAVVRAGNNSQNTNPYSIYTVNSGTGAPTLLSGPILNPLNASNLQVNGVGLNTADGYLYALSSEIPASPSFTPSTPFFRMGSNAGVLQLGTVSGPAPSVGLGENASFVNAAAGEFDHFNNYYFTAVTGNLVVNFLSPLSSTFTPSSFYIGKLSGVSILSGGTGALSPSYVKLYTTDPSVTAYFTSLTTSITLSTAVNTGLRDFIYEQTTNLLATYVTFPDPSNPSQFMGQMLKVNPATGEVKSVAPAVVLPFVNSSVEMAGTFIDKDGKFLILFSDGTMYKANTNTSGRFDGSISLLNAATGLPNPLRGDMASCGTSINAGPLPVLFETLNVYAKASDNIIQFSLSHTEELKEVIVEKSIDGQVWQRLHVAAFTSGANRYEYVDATVSTKQYYRVVLISKDGSTKYSATKLINRSNSAVQLVVYPNPATRVVYVKSNVAFVSTPKLVVLNAQGKQVNVISKKVQDNMLELNIEHLPKGAYWLKCYNDATEVVVQKFIK